MASGYLWKSQLSGKSEEWQRRYFVVRRDVLVYYSSVGSKSEIGRFDLTQLHTVTSQKANTVALEFHGNLVLKLKGGSAEEMTE